MPISTTALNNSNEVKFYWIPYKEFYVVCAAADASIGAEAIDIKYEAITTDNFSDEQDCAGIDNIELTTCKPLIDAAASSYTDISFLVVPADENANSIYVYIVYAYDNEDNEKIITLIKQASSNAGSYYKASHTFPYLINVSTYGNVQRWINHVDNNENETKMDFKLYIKGDLPSKETAHKGSLYWITSKTGAEANLQRLYMCIDTDKFLRIDLPDDINRGAYTIQDPVLEGPNAADGKTILKFYATHYYDENTQTLVEADGANKEKAYVGRVDLTALANFHCKITTVTTGDNAGLTTSTYIPDDISNIPLVGNMSLDNYGHVTQYTNYKINTRYKWETL